MKNNNLKDLFFFSIEFKDPPIYGCDVARSFTDPDLDVWNLSKLNTILNIVNNDLDTVIQGMAIRVVEFSSGGYKIRKIFYKRINMPQRNY